MSNLPRRKPEQPVFGPVEPKVDGEVHVLGVDYAGGKPKWLYVQVIENGVARQRRWKVVSGVQFRRENLEETT